MSITVHIAWETDDPYDPVAHGTPTIPMTFANADELRGFVRGAKAASLRYFVKAYKAARVAYCTGEEVKWLLPKQFEQYAMRLALLGDE